MNEFVLCVRRTCYQLKAADVNEKTTSWLIWFIFLKKKESKKRFEIQCYLNEICTTDENRLSISFRPDYMNNSIRCTNDMVSELIIIQNMALYINSLPIIQSKHIFRVLSAIPEIFNVSFLHTNTITG